MNDVGKNFLSTEYCNGFMTEWSLRSMSIYAALTFSLARGLSNVFFPRVDEYICASSPAAEYGDTSYFMSYAEKPSSRPGAHITRQTATDEVVTLVKEQHC